jgi:hypothetical protein
VWLNPSATCLPNAGPPIAKSAGFPDTEGPRGSHRWVPSMQIVVKTLCPDPVSKPVQGPPPSGEGKWFVFSKNLALERLDNNTPGDGLPLNQQQRLSGSYSGIVTTLRVATATDFLYHSGSYLFQYEAIYRFNAVQGTPLQQGQITAHGVFYGAVVNNQFQPLEPPNALAITGGTAAYSTARGQITQQPTPPNQPTGTEVWLLDLPVTVTDFGCRLVG